jgi:hypothetical protein
MAHIPESELAWTAPGDPAAGELYTHTASGAVYRVVGVALQAGDATVRVVVYAEPENSSHMWVRPVAQFRERFQHNDSRTRSKEG